MHGAHGFIDEHTAWNLLSVFKIDHPFFYISRSLCFFTWAVLFFLIITIILIRLAISTNNGIARYGIIFATRSFINITRDSLGVFNARHAGFALSIFLFILFCNLMGIVPFMEEPTADLNTTIGLALMVFFYTNIAAIQHHGLIHYIKSYFKPFVFMLPLNIIEKFSSVISMSFRLFGNIMAGSVICNLFNGLVCTQPTAWYMYQFYLIGPLAGIIIYGFFGLFEALIQAFVFTTLTLTYLGMEIKQEHD